MGSVPPHEGHPTLARPAAEAFHELAIGPDEVLDR
jgi:hypothetical protein